MIKEPNGQRIQIIDKSGNAVNFIWSKAKNLTLAADFEPGFPFQVHVGTGGTLVGVPLDNVGNLDPKEDAYFRDSVVSIVVTDNSFIPIWFSKLVFAGTTATGLTIGK